MANKIFDYLVKYFPKDLTEIIIQYGYKLYGVCECTLKGHTDMIMCLAILPSNDGEYLISGSCDKTLKIWDIKTYECIKTLVGHTDTVNCVGVFSEQLTASGSESQDTSVKLWNTKNHNDNTLIATLVGHTDAVMSIVFISEKLLVSSSYDKTVKIWNIEKELCVLTLTGHTESVTSCAILSVNQANSTIDIISGSSDGTLKIWTIKNESDLKLSLMSHHNIINQIQCIHNVLIHPVYKIGIASKLLISLQKVIKIFNTKTLKCEKTLHGQPGSAKCLAILPDGQLISGLDDRTLKVWNIIDNNDLCNITFKGHTSSVYDVVVLADGRIASCSLDSTIKIWY